MEADDAPDVGDYEVPTEALADGESRSTTKQNGSNNAFAELMKPKTPKLVKSSSVHKDPKTDTSNLWNPRNGLLPYIQAPDKAAPGSVITYTDAFVLIRDAYPKSSVHLLLLPRDPKFANIHPFEALSDADFLAATKIEVAKAKEIAASELRRIHGRYSATEKPRTDALASDEPPDELPDGRDWHKDIMVGVHTHPSMNHMHVHVLSRDMHSTCTKHRSHYNSFNTEFLCPIDAFPLSEDEKERRLHLEWHEMDMLCWRCKRNYKHSFAKLKAHLEKEFVAWRQE